MTDAQAFHEFGATRIPVAFAEVAANLKSGELAAKFGITDNTARKWKRRLGIPVGRIAAPPPADFASFAPGKTERQLRQRYGAGSRRIARWRKLCGINPNAITKERVEPIAGFAASAKTMHISALAKHYKRDKKTIKRWLQELGIEAKTFVYCNGTALGEPGRRTKIAARAPSPRGRMIVGNRVLPIAQKAGRDEAAAQFLRRTSHVYRCNERGGFELEGKFWRYGNVVLAPEEMMARAERHGFDPHGWERLA